MSGNASDEHLVNLRAEEDGPPPPKPANNSSTSKKGNRGNRKRVPNQGPASKAGRISARRIGGANLQDDFEAYRSMKEQMLKKNSSSSLQPTSLGTNNVKSKAKPSIQGALPKVQELGGSLTNHSRRMSNRRSSSRLNMGVKNRSRTESNDSSNSGTATQVTDGTHLIKEKEMIIRYGELLKKAVITTGWKSRFFVLTDKSLLYFLESFDNVPQDMSQMDPSLVPKGKIDLSIVDEVRKDKNDKTGSIFNIFTPTRTYRLRMPKDEKDESEDGVSTRHGASVWVAVLKGAIENAKQQHLNVGVHPRGSFSSYKVDEVDNVNVSASQFKHPTKRLIDSERYAANARPHKPANLDEYEEWTPFDVAAWLYTVHLQKYSEDLYKLQVDGKKLKAVNTAQDAKALGIEEDDVEDFLNGIQTLRDMNQLSENNPLL